MSLSSGAGKETAATQDHVCGVLVLLGGLAGAVEGIFPAVVPNGTVRY